MNKRLLAAILVPLLAATACAASPDVFGGTDGAHHVLVIEAWPREGQGAYVLGDGQQVASPSESPVPIASLAKVMTAYLVLKHFPLQPGGSGPLFMVGKNDVAETDRMRHGGQSIVDIQAGEQLSERDALMAILLPSANNVALLIARQVAGSVSSFVDEMNGTARTLGMSRTRYTDPSGYDASTVSTAQDQLRLARLVAENGTLAAMMATPSYSLPIAGTVSNTDTLLGQDGFVGMKTGSDSAAGGCFMFRSSWHVTSGVVTLIGVVLGQRRANLIDAGLSAARELVNRLSPYGGFTVTGTHTDVERVRSRPGRGQ